MSATRAGALRIAVLAATALAFGCGGSQEPAELDDPAALEIPSRLAVPPGIARRVVVDIPRDASLDDAVALTRDAIAAVGFEPFDPTLDNSRSLVRNFARYLTFGEPMATGESVFHVVFVSVEPWDETRADRFIQTFFSLPWGTPVEAGPPWFHFVGLHEAPFEVTYLFGNEWWGVLESAMLLASSTAETHSTSAEGYLESVYAVLGEFGLTARADPRMIDGILGRLPRPPEGTDYLPAGTLAGLGMVLGDAVMQREPDVHWVPGEEAFATLWALGIDGHPDACLRPIDFLREAWSGGTAAPATGYLDLVHERLAALRAGG